MNPNSTNDMKKSTILQQAERHMNHGHSILHRDKETVIDKRLLKLEQNAREMAKYLPGNQHHNNNMKNPSIESTIINNVSTIMESKICQIVETSIKSLLSNNINQIIKQNINNNNNNNNNNENDDIKLDDTNGNNICITQIIENQHKLMNRLDELSKIQHEIHKVYDKMEKIENKMEKNENNVNEVKETIDEPLLKSIHKTVQNDEIKEDTVATNVNNDLVVQSNNARCPISEDKSDDAAENESNEDGTISNTAQNNLICNVPLLSSMINRVAPSNENNTLPIKIVQNRNGDLLFVETKAEFVNLLRLVQRVPIGILAKTIQNENVLNVLEMSIENLSNDHFVLPKGDTLISTDMTMTNLDLLESRAVSVTLKSGGTMDCEGRDSGPYTCKGHNKGSWKNGVAFCGLGNSFEISLLLPNPPGGMMLGILPDDSNLSSRCATKDVYSQNGFFLLPRSSSGKTHPSSNKNYPEIFQRSNAITGKELKMKFQQGPQKLEYSYDGGPWYQVEIQKGYGIESTTKCCPVVLSCNTHPLTVTRVKCVDNKNLIKETLLKSNSTFLISNELNISTSFVNHYQKNEVDDLSTLQISTMNFGCVELWKLIDSILKGERNVLEAALFF